jgi:hypothetical protein
MNVSLADLESLLPPDDVYPAGVVLPIRPRIKGRSFFPGGCGLAFGLDQPYPHRPIMLVGQDFDNAEGWNEPDEEKLQRGEENSPTWQGIAKLQSAGLINLNRCYFTNALLGARISPINTKPSPALNEHGYVEASLDRLESQIKLLRPTVVVALGSVPATLIARRLEVVSREWPNKSAPPKPTRKAKFTEIDAANLVFRRNVQGPDGVSFAFATCTHPSLPNERHLIWTRNGMKEPSAHTAIWLAIRDHDEAVRTA